MNGRSRVEDNELAERDISAKDKYNIDKVRKLSKSDRRLACDNISQEVDIGVEIVHSIYQNKLKKRKVFRALITPIAWRQNAECRSTIAPDFLSRLYN